MGKDAPSPAPVRSAIARYPRLVRCGVTAAAAAYTGYLALLVTCDLRVIAPLGFVPQFQPGRVTIATVQPASIGARAGLAPGDRLTSANGQILLGRADWDRVRVHLDPSVPLELEVERGGTLTLVPLVLPAGLGEWRPGVPRPGLLAFRLAQIITLAIAVLVAFRSGFQPSALLGALLLASIATVSVVLPMGIVTFWNALPAPIGLTFWMPFATSVAVGPLLFAFFGTFPQRRWSAATLAGVLLPAVVIVGWHVFAWHRVMSSLGPPTAVPDWSAAVFFSNVVYAAFGVALLVGYERADDTLTDRRRRRVLIIGAVIGGAAGFGVLIGYWRHPGVDIFGTRTMTVLALAFLAVPASFAYAILRHRLFDIRLIVRRGVRYALARRFVDALGPALGALLVIDVVLHRTESVSAMLQSRWWWYASLGGALLLVRARRERWLETIDRQFFRERYDAQRLLGSLAGQVARASHFDDVVPAAVRQIDEALHPRFVSVLRHVPAETQFSAVPGGSTDGHSVRLPSSLAVIGVLSVLRKPLTISLGDTAWVRHQLPLTERTLLVEHGIEVLVPICSRVPGDLPMALLVLGPRRSEEPYNEEDLELLVTIAEAVGALLERSSSAVHVFAECDSCGRCFDAGVAGCTEDAGPLTTSAGSRVLSGRYRLERRLGRGGMGTVYAAVDDVLERPVAVKVIREDVAGPLDLGARFRQEARAAAGFGHPNVVRVYDFGVDHNVRPFLVMELLEGQTLRLRIAGGTPMPAAETLHVLRGICAAIDAAHRVGLVHRDLKPENIFLQVHAAGVVPKVLDFGLAKAFATGQALEARTTSATSAGLIVGTLDYMAPEQVAGDLVNPAWDIWALGVIAYEMVAGTHPFRRRVTFANDDTVGLATTSERPGRHMSAKQCAFFQSALAPDRALRPRDAREFLDGCEKALA